MPPGHPVAVVDATFRIIRKACEYFHGMPTPHQFTREDRRDGGRLWLKPLREKTYLHRQVLEADCSSWLSLRVGRTVYRAFVTRAVDFPGMVR
jgi:hypothetical protein